MKANGAARLVLVGLVALGLLVGSTGGSTAAGVGPTRALLAADPRITDPDLNYAGEQIPISPIGVGYARAFAINDRGQVVGVGGLNNHAFLWQDGTMADLGTLGGWSEAYGINDRGQVVGTSTTASGPVSHAFLWQDGTMTDLGILPGGRYSWASAINDRGQVVGLNGAASGTHAFLWQDGTMTDLGTLGGDGNSWASAINDRGQIVGGSPTKSALHAFLWQDGTMTDLGTLPGDAWSNASAINDRGQVVGTSTTASQIHRAFLWQEGTMTDLGTLPGEDSSEAWAINDRGQVVGRAWSHTAPSPVGHAFLWQDGAMTDLGTLPGGRWSEASDIDDRGRVVGRSDGYAVLWQVPPGPPTKLGFTDPGLGEVFAGQPFDHQPIVQVLDAQGTVVQTVPVTVTLSLASGAAGALSCAKGNSRATFRGVAAFSGCAIDTKSTGVRLVASAPGLEAATSDPVTVSATAPPSRPTPSLQAPPTPVAAGQHLALAVSIPGGAHEVELYSLLPGDPGWQWEATTDTDGTGHGTFDTVLYDNVLLQACHVRSPGEASGGECGKVIPLNVRLAVTLSPRPKSRVQSVRAGTTVQYRAAVSPFWHGGYGPTVTFSVYRLVKGKWVLYGKPGFVHEDVSDGVLDHWVTWQRGEWYLKAVAKATPYNLAGSSLPIRVSVH